YSETGAKLDIKKVAELAYRHRKVLILDGVALLGKELFTLPLGVQGMGFSSHKLHGPKGAGLVYLARGAECRPLLVGGHQEKGLRAGTENLPAILGFVKAVEIAYSHLPQLTERLLFLREHFETSLAKLVPLVINGEGERVCNVSNLAFKGVEGETLLLALDRASIYASLGSACASGALEPSRVLLNMSLSRERAKSSLRFSFSRYTTQEEVDEAVETIVGIIERLSSQGL
ncbi:MAG: aminotransferase class V-fold PLP-dependent enzyme, partial [Chlamydiae bacterium]|nr:aminotransferase class V-fold PLP-dependent enzyme [Chlamydiota bacterium]